MRADRDGTWIEMGQAWQAEALVRGQVWKGTNVAMINDVDKNKPWFSFSLLQMEPCLAPI